MPVSVTTDGSSVRGLTRDNFKLRVNGKAQPIDYFDVVDFAALSDQQMRDPRQRRLYVLTFDLPNTAPFAMYRAKRAAEEYLANAQPSDYFAVALVNRYGDIDFLVPFTRDRDALRRAVATFHAASPKDPLRLTVTPAERAVFTFDNRAEIEQLRHMGANEAADQMIEANRDRLSDELDALRKSRAAVGAAGGLQTRRRSFGRIRLRHVDRQPARPGQSARNRRAAIRRLPQSDPI